MSLHGPIIVVAEQPAAELVEALGAAGAFPIVEASWSEAPTAFVAVKPAGVVIAEAGLPESESAARMLCLQIATAAGPIVPVIARVDDRREAAIPIALPADAAQPVERLVARLSLALRVRAMHATVLRRIEAFASQSGKLPAMPLADALEDATVLVVGRGPLYPALSVAIAERVKMVGALNVALAAKHLAGRDIDGIVVGDGLSPRMVEDFLGLLAQEARFRDIPVTVIGEAPDAAASLGNVECVDGDPECLVSRLLPLVRLHAFETRLKRMLASLEAEGMVNPDTGLFTREAFWSELARAIAEAAERSQALSIARLTFEGASDLRLSLDAARLLPRLIRNIDFALRDDDGALLIVFTQTDLRSAHVVARRVAAALKNSLFPGRAHDKLAANLTLATLKNGDTLDSLLLRVMGSRVVAAE